MNTETIQYIYIIQPREFYNHNELVYKIGKTKKLNLYRFNQYPKGSVLLFQMVCKDCDVSERKVIKHFTNNYKHRKDVGAEYFEGDFIKMIDDIYNILKGNIYIEVKKQDLKNLARKCDEKVDEKTEEKEKIEEKDKEKEKNEENIEEKIDEKVVDNIKIDDINTNNYKKITKYLQCDILIHRNDISKNGFDKHKTEDEIIALANKHKCPIIIKNGLNGKWYLKGKKKSIECLKQYIEDNIGKKKREGCYCLLLE